MDDEERKKKIDAINARIEHLKERQQTIPLEIEQLENARREVRARILDATQRVQERIMEEKGKGTEATLVKQSKEMIEKARNELRSITLNVKERVVEQINIPDQIEELEKEKTKLLHP